MEKVGIVTAHTGYNYGTYLQAYAMKKFLNQLGFDSRIIWQKSFGPKGRDFRLKKMIVMTTRMAINYRYSAGAIQGYTKNFAAEPSEKSKAMFDDFSMNCLSVEEYTLHGLKKFSRSKDVKAVICGSDQIWSAASMYPDPLYYLRFAPREKRIAYAPSFGKSNVPTYNKKRIGKFLRDIPNVSVRETAGAEIVKELTGKKVEVMPDPTLIVDWNDWQSFHKEDYLLAYFLDEPQEYALNDIKKISEVLNLRIKVVLAEHKSYRDLPEYEFIDAGPKEFVDMISRASFVCTDSFHGTIFSILGKTKFYTYPRNYGKVQSQSSRIETLLNHYNLKDRLRSADTDISNLGESINFEQCEVIRKIDFQKATLYMEKALNTCLTVK